jgi:hypothetical protein
LEIHRGLGVKVPAFPENRHPAYEERTAAQIGGIHSPTVWVLSMKNEECGQNHRHGVARMSKAAVTVPKAWAKGLTGWVLARFEKSATTED